MLDYVFGIKDIMLYHFWLCRRLLLLTCKLTIPLYYIIQWLHSDKLYYTMRYHLLHYFFRYNYTNFPKTYDMFTK